MVRVKSKDLEKMCPECGAQIDYEEFKRMKYDYNCPQCRKCRMSKWVLQEKKSKPKS
jgi:Zn-finger nucleic acid-binding protein